MKFYKNQITSEVIQMLDKDEIFQLAPHFGISLSDFENNFHEELHQQLNSFSFSEITNLLFFTCAPVMEMLLRIKQFLSCIGLGVRGTCSFAIGNIDESIILPHSISAWQINQSNPSWHSLHQIDAQIKRSVMNAIQSFPPFTESFQKPDYLKKAVRGTIYEDILGDYDYEKRSNYTTSDINLLLKIKRSLMQLNKQLRKIGPSNGVNQAIIIMNKLIVSIQNSRPEKGLPTQNIKFFFPKLLRIINNTHERISGAVSLIESQSYVSDFLAMDLWKQRWRIYEMYIVSEILSKFIDNGFHLTPLNLTTNNTWYLKYANAKEPVALLKKDHIELQFYYQGTFSSDMRDYMPDIMIKNINGEVILVCDPKHGISYNFSKIKKVCELYNDRFKAALTIIVNYYNMPGYKFQLIKNANSTMSLIASGISPNSLASVSFDNAINYLITNKFNIVSNSKKKDTKMNKLTNIPYILFFSEDYELDYKCLQCTPANRYQPILIADNQQSEHRKPYLRSNYAFLPDGTIVFAGENNLWFTSILRSFYHQGPTCDDSFPISVYQDYIAFKSQKSKKLIIFDIRKKEIIFEYDADMHSCPQFSPDGGKIAFINREYDVNVIYLDTATNITLGKAYCDNYYRDKKAGKWIGWLSNIEIFYCQALKDNNKWNIEKFKKGDLFIRHSLDGISKTCNLGVTSNSFVISPDKQKVWIKGNVWSFVNNSFQSVREEASTFASWSNDSTKLAFVSCPPNRKVSPWEPKPIKSEQIYIFDFSNNSLEVLTDEEMGCSCPTFS